MNRTSVYHQIIQHFGSKTGLAEALGISKQAVSGWGEAIPEGRAWQIEAITKGRFKAQQIIAAQREPKAAA